MIILLTIPDKVLHILERDFKISSTLFWNSDLNGQRKWMYFASVAAHYKGSCLL